MAAFSTRFLSVGLATAGLALILAACSETTYGTGTAPGVQTLQDIAGIAAFGAPEKEPIKYQARPAIVAPPPGTPLPPPGEDNPAVAANWPVDPDAEYAQFKADVAARQKECEENRTPYYCQDPNFRLPPKEQSRQPSPTLLGIDPEEEAHTTASQAELAKKLYADSRGMVAVDASGKPIRRYLSDPPPEYREPDPNAPVEIENKPAVPKKWKWPWEQ